MTPFYDDGRVTLYVGDCLAVLRELEAGSAQTCVTSPPYWGLRDYGLAPIIWGGDPEHAHAWGGGLRLHKGGPHGDGALKDGGRGVIVAQAAVKNIDAGALCDCGAWRGQLGLEPTPEFYVEHLVGVFREVRRVLRDDGTLWLNLGDCYATGAGAVGEHPGGGEQGARWKGASTTLKAGPKTAAAQTHMGPMTQPNRMPIPGLKPKDLVGIPWRVAFALQADGWWLRRDNIWHKPNPMPESVSDRCTSSHEYLFHLAKSETYFYDAEAIKEPVAEVTLRDRVDGDRFRPDRGFPGAASSGNGRLGESSVRNKRSVWTVATTPYPEAHFATFPPDLIKPCILAGAPAGAVVLDPFAGAGTTLYVAKELGRRAVGVELNTAYAEMILQRVRQGVLF